MNIRMTKNKANLADYDAVIFDMDGVLIDSEPLWKIAMQAAFDEVGCKLTKKDFQQTVGLRIDEVISYWYLHSPWTGASKKEVEERIISKMVELIQANGDPLPGVIDTLKFLNKYKMPVGLGTSSYRLLIETVLRVLKVEKYFAVTHTAEDEEMGKPHPAVYLTVAKKLGVSPRKCLVIEDSFTGLIAGKAAGMRVAVIPEKTHEPNPKLIAGDFLYDSMQDLLEELKQ